MKKLLTLVQVLDNLSRMPRTGGVMFAGIDPNRTDSVAEHNFKVVSLTLLFGEVFKKQGYSINFENLLKVAVTHDWNESILLDIPSGSPSYKSYFTDMDIRKATRQAEQQASESIRLYVAEYLTLETNEDNLSADESAILAISDITALLIEALEWKYQGLRYEWIDYLWSNTLNRLMSVSEPYAFLSGFIDELQKAYETGVKPPNPFLTKPEFQSLKK